MTKALRVLVLTSCAAACGGTYRSATPTLEGHAAAATNRHAGTDVKFMQDMIVHHAQALEMARLASARSSRDNIKLLAERVDISQTAEIARMQRWLEVRGESVSDSTSHHGHAGNYALMPGMISAEDLARLADAEGHDFDRLFLELLIRHHEGALVMVRYLFGTEGAVFDPGLYILASDIDADQRAEISRMRRMLETL